MDNVRLEVLDRVYWVVNREVYDGVRVKVSWEVSVEVGVKVTDKVKRSV